jgi:hypothetical protein
VAEALAEAPCPVAYTGALGADAALVPFLLDRVAEARPVLAQAASAGSARSRERHMASASA